MSLLLFQERQRRRWQERRQKWHQKTKILEDRTDKWRKDREEKELKAKMVNVYKENNK